jgi:hypothetical protein
VAVFGNACACSRSAGRPFALGKDSFAFRNHLQWTYEFRENGEAVTRDVEPPAKYPLRCFPMTRTAREFFYHAEFAPELPKVSADEYAVLVKKVVRRNSRCPSEPGKRIVIPGYADLSSLSADYEPIFRRYSGGPRQSYFQRGNWRMIFPVPKWQNRRTARRLGEEINGGRTPIIHVYRFPDVSLNHSLLLYRAERNGPRTLFRAYDPNDPSRPAELVFDAERSTFLFERNQYFAGGWADVYEVYRGWCY